MPETNQKDEELFQMSASFALTEYLGSEHKKDWKDHIARTVYQKLNENTDKTVDTIFAETMNHLKNMDSKEMKAYGTSYPELREAGKALYLSCVREYRNQQMIDHSLREIAAWQLEQYPIDADNPTPKSYLAQRLRNTILGDAEHPGCSLYDALDIVGLSYEKASEEELQDIRATRKELDAIRTELYEEIMKEFDNFTEACSKAAEELPRTCPKLPEQEEAKDHPAEKMQEAKDTKESRTAAIRNVDLDGAVPKNEKKQFLYAMASHFDGGKNRAFVLEASKDCLMKGFTEDQVASYIDKLAPQALDDADRKKRYKNAVSYSQYILQGIQKDKAFQKELQEAGRKNR